MNLENIVGSGLSKPVMEFVSAVRVAVLGREQLLHHVEQLTIWFYEELGREVDWVTTAK